MLQSLSQLTLATWQPEKLGPIDIEKHIIFSIATFVFVRVYVGQSLIFFVQLTTHLLVFVAIFVGGYGEKDITWSVLWIVFCMYYYLIALQFNVSMTMLNSMIHGVSLHCYSSL